MKIKIKKLSENAVVPVYANRDDAGMDLFSNEDLVLKPKHRTKVKTGISFEIPTGFAGLIWDKSGVASSGIKTTAGVIDSGFRGEIQVVLVNLSSKKYEIKKGQKVAQILFQKIERPKIEIVENLSNSTRGKGGFGSTGLFN